MKKFERGEAFIYFDVPEGIKKTVKKPIYGDEGKKLVGVAIFRKNGYIGLYVIQRVYERINDSSKLYLRRMLGDREYTLGFIREDVLENQKFIHS